jgi:nucleotide-binding universal stress UspA family protein
MVPPRTILVPTDFSAPADAALEIAATIAIHDHAQLLLLHVDPPPVSHGEVVDRRQPEYQQRLEDRIKSVRIPNKAIEVERMLAEGIPAEKIAAIANSRGCDMIVMGTHGRTGIERIIMGSVAERVLRLATCPVLAVKSVSHRPAASGPTNN